MTFDDIIAFVESLFSELVNALQGVLNAIVSWVTDLANFIWQGLVDVAQHLGDLWDRLHTFLDDLWHGYLPQWIDQITEWIDSATTWLADVLDPIITFITELQAWVQTYIIIPLEAIIEVLQRVRVVLSALALLGQKWAAKLDADLARIQGYLTGALQVVVGTLNNLSTWMNIIVDPAQVIRSDFFTGTLFSQVGMLQQAANYGKDRPLYASEAANEAQDKALFNGGAAVGTYNADGTFTYSDASARMKASFTAEGNYYGLPGGTP